ncbi:hypothetical protein [Mucilaginibacter sp. UR6-11]|uniref:hypothetical protein n=1 Tax=Mucilaginibacter sp. UR6-11 TaxID=1435644 RepID=UPI001E59833D|nr:hypothetical protein [Mucilaginibacter sp. UR6-11]MCC8423581.1 hypothetical protein [Mucilaginibacter sp. UR6-11]
MPYNGSITSQVKPLKFCFLVDYSDQNQFLKAIEMCSALWGGAYCPILPIYKRKPRNWKERYSRASIASVLIGYINGFDPDIFVKLAKELPHEITELSLTIIEEKDFWRQHGNPVNSEPDYGISIYHVLNKIYEEHFKYQAKNPVKVYVPDLGNRYRLFWAALFGSYSKPVNDALKQHYYAPLEINEDSNALAHFDLMLDPNVLFPRRLTQQFLHSRNKNGFRGKSYLLFIDANRMDDVTDYWNLRACGQLVVAIAVQYLRDEAARKLALSYLLENFRPRHLDSEVYADTTVIISSNVRQEEVMEFMRSLEVEKHVTITGHNHIVSYQYWFPRIWDEWAIDKDGIIPEDFYSEEKEFHLDQVQGAEIYFDLLIPEFVQNKQSYTGHPVCVNAINLRLYGSDQFAAAVFPKASGRNYLRAIGSTTGLRRQWRIGRSGMNRLVNYAGHERWKLPEPESLFFGWLKDKGYEANISVPGLIAKRLYEILEGYIHVLANEKLLNLLEYMNGGAVALGKPKKKTGDQIPIYQERAVDFGELKRRLRTPAETDGLLDYLVDKKVFQVGLKVKCPHCFRESWYPMEKLDNQLDCKLCLNHFGATGTVEKGNWSYKTAGPFSIPQFASGAFAVLLALRQLSSFELIHFQTTPVTSFEAISPNGQKLEADYAMFWQDNNFSENKEGTLFGESKTFNSFKTKDFHKMAALAKQFPGAVLVFSTLKKTLTDAEIRGIKAIAKKGAKYWKNDGPVNPVLVLTGNELLTSEAIPWCWPDYQGSYTQRFYDICQETQKRYLGLPPWKQSWTNLTRSSATSRT